MSWDEVERWRLLQPRMEAAPDASPLPDRPDVHRADQWLQSVRRRGVKTGSWPDSDR